MEIREALRTRRSIRAYEDRAVPRGVIEEILECARWSPSGRNVQPWSFVVLTDKEKLRQIAEITDMEVSHDRASVHRRALRDTRTTWRMAPS